jgi:Flp pilus assembly secretin CpaC
MQRTKTNTELIIIVTPEIVAPIAAGSGLPELKFPQPFLPTNSGIADAHSRMPRLRRIPQPSAANHPGGEAD